ncbi:MAG: ABC transporter substrate-binding protein [Candidatus Rokuibacteriota bacterium]|nr:MAG: ABC transporter substrate-binding protein [Candidatus Rokubacteria bacterium]
MKERLKLLAPVVLGLAVAFSFVGYSAASGQKRAASDTLVYAASADATLLDPSLVQDGESLRTTDQIFNSLVGFKLGGTDVVPELATSWSYSKNHKVWTFKLRKGVKFSDGTPFDAAAVCFNYSRWYDFPAPLQSDALSYYWQTVFHGFANPAPGNPGPDKSLYHGCRTHGKYSVSIILNSPSSSFLTAAGIPNFGIASPTALKKYQADAGTVDSTGVFHPTGTFATQHPIGTGPYMLQSWAVGSKITLVRNPNYWGPKPKIARVIIVPIGDPAARLQALQTGEVQAYDNVDPNNFAQIKGKYKLYKRPPFSVGYIGINQAFPPFNNLKVRQALAYAIDKGPVVKAFYGGVGSVANQFLPPALFGNAKKGVPTYTYNPNKSKQLLQQAGVKLPLNVDFWYPTNVSRPYMPKPQNNFEAFAADMEKAGFHVTPHTAPWRPEYRAGLLSGHDQLFLFGWIADFGDPADFLNIHFGQKLSQFGFTNPSLFALLAKADAEPNYQKRVALYQKASIQVMKFLPVIPYVWAGSGIAFDSNVKGFVPGPIGPINEPFAKLSYGS